MVTTGLTALPLEEGELWFDPAFLDRATSARMEAALLEEVAWRQDRIQLFGRSVAIPRLQAWQGDPGCRYRYSGLWLEPAPWSPTCALLRERLEERLTLSFNAVLLNLYRDGNDSVGWHADSEPELGPEPVIASLTLGAERRFCLRHKRDKARRLEVRLPPGALLVMAGPLQHHWLHALPKSRAVSAPRINLSFRRIVAPQSA